MTAAGASIDLQTWCIVWFVVAIALVIRHWRAGQGVGLLLTYVVSFGVIHWLSALIYLFPWFVQPGGEEVAEGMRQSSYAIVAFAIGAECATWFSLRRIERRRAVRATAVNPKIINLYLGTGAVLYLVTISLASKITTIGALIATGSTVVVVGLVLKCWNSWCDGNGRRLAMWLVVAAMLPFVTVATQGFLGYGMAAMATICAFVASFHPSKAKTLVLASLLGFVGLSVYVTYMRDRKDLRESIKGGSSVSATAERVVSTLSNFEWFDPANPDHLYRVDDRLNQNFLVGEAVSYLSLGGAPFAHGATVADALMAMVPRVFWPDRQTAVGSGDLVATYTGRTFLEGTSVGIGQVLECYVNFGTMGVLVGFILIGGALKTIDLFAYRALSRGDARHFTLIYLPGLAMLQVGGSFVDVTSVGAAGLGMAFLLNFVTTRFVRDHQQVNVAAAQRATPGETPVEVRE